MAKNRVYQLRGPRTASFGRGPPERPGWMGDASGACPGPVTGAGTFSGRTAGSPGTKPSIYLGAFMAFLLHNRAGGGRMKAFTIRAALLVAGLGLAAGPALAQKAGPGGGGNGGGGGNAGGGGATVSGGSVVGSGSSSGATSSSSGGGFSSPSMGGGASSASYGGMRGGAMRTAAPEHRTSVSYSANQHAT